MTEPFTIKPPLGYEPDIYCASQHPVVYKHTETGHQYIPLRLNNVVACILCMANFTGVQCQRSHMAFEIEVGVGD